MGWVMDGARVIGPECWGAEAMMVTGRREVQVFKVDRSYGILFYF
jgi:hypothetical protein